MGKQQSIIALDDQAKGGKQGVRGKPKNIYA